MMEFLQCLPDHKANTLEEKNMEATFVGDITMVEDLMTHKGLDINARNNRAIENSKYYGYTAMELAIVMGKNNIVRLILQHPDYDITLKNSKHHYTVLHFVAMMDLYGYLIRMVLAHEKAMTIINCTDDRGYTALNIACSRNHVGVIRELLKIGQVEGNTVNILSFTPMVEAIIFEKADAVEELLDHDVDCNFSPNLALFPYLSPLGLAIKTRSLATVASLLDHGAATTSTATLDVILSSEPDINKQSVKFECENMATLAMNVPHRWDTRSDRRSAAVMAKTITACAGLADLDTVFMLYTGVIKGSMRGNSTKKIHVDRSMKDEEQRLKCLVLRSVIYKSLGTNTSPELLTYLMQKYGLQDDEDDELLIPCKSGILQLQRALDYREYVVKRSGAGNFMKGMQLMNQELDRQIGEKGKNMLNLDWCADYYVFITKMT